MPTLGFGPILTEMSKILTLTLLTIVYLFFWLSLGILYSVPMKRTSTSIMTSIATWLTFSIMISILASVIAGVMVPLPEKDIIEGGDRIKLRDDYMEALQQRNAVIFTINKISPTNLYEEAASEILGVTGGFALAKQEFQRTLTLGEALTANWANIATIVVGLII